MKSFLPFLLIAALCACGSATDTKNKRKNHAKAGNLEFFETYQIRDISREWQEACKLSAEADTLALQGEIPLDQIELRGLKGLVRIGETNALGYVKKSDMAEVGSILTTPEIAALFPKDLRFMWSMNPFTEDNSGTFYELFAVKATPGKKARINGSHILESVPETDPNTGKPNINLTMTKEGSHEWESMTRENTNRFIAITLDQQVLSCPKVLMTIAGGKTQISGNFSMEEAGELSDRINAGK